MIVAFLTSDLVFPSRISPTVERLGGRLVTATNVDALVENLNAQGAPPPVVIVDLNAPAIDPATTIPRLLQLAVRPAAIIAFAPHVHEARLVAAKSSGCNIVLTRGQFNSQIDGLLSTLLVNPDDAPDVKADR